MVTKIINGLNSDFLFSKNVRVKKIPCTKLQASFEKTFWIIKLTQVIVNSS